MITSSKVRMVRDAVADCEMKLVVSPANQEEMDRVEANFKTIQTCPHTMTLALARQNYMINQIVGMMDTILDESDLEEAKKAIQNKDATYFNKEEE